MSALDERFWAKVDRRSDAECWLWLAATAGAGYGQFGANGKSVRAHRYAYEALVGPIPDGLEIDHLCNIRLCVNPGHMEPVTHAENVRRGLRLNTIRGPLDGTTALEVTRRAHGVTRTELARISGASLSYLRKVELGIHTPSARFLQRMTQALREAAS